jgi:hypothetical protein
MIAIDAQGALGGLCTLWSNQEVRLEHHIKTQHWILTKFFHKQSNTMCIIIKVYMPINPSQDLS